jgi:hypothetical protein
MPDDTEDPDSTPSRLDRTRYDLVFTDDFTGQQPDAGRWVPHYLPHWTTPERSACRYLLDSDGLKLLIEADQPAWRPEDGGMRVSNLQTGSFSGPLGSSIGQHRHRPDLLVRTPQVTRRHWTPSAGLVEARVSACADDDCMLGIWLVGFEASSPQDSGEICLAELFGHALGAERSIVRLGVKAHHDPRLRTEVVDLPLDLDATEEHTYAAEWDAHRVSFFVDDVLVHSAAQGLDYDLQLMVDLFEFPADEVRDAGGYPKSGRVRAVRGYAPR